MAELAISMSTTTDRQRIAHEGFQKILSSWNENSHHEMTEYYKKYGKDLRRTEKVFFSSSCALTPALVYVIKSHQKWNYN
jgi:hypothetical protein